MKQAILAAVASLILCAPSHAAVLFSQTLTGAGLQGDSNVTIFENPTLNGTSLDYTGRSTTRGALLRWDVLGASSYNDLTVTIQIDHTALNGPDNDLFIGISDGVNVVAPARIDEGTIRTFDGSVGGSPAAPTLALDGTGVSDILGSLGSVDPITLSFLLPSDGSNTTLLSVEENGSSVSNVVLDRALTVDDGLQFFLFGDNVSEQYAINSISITVAEADPVPAPGALGIFALGLIGLGYRRIRQIA
jgi:hypothetical protein